MDGDIYVVEYYPDGVRHILTTGSLHYIGLVDDLTILKYPHFEGELDGLKVEWEIYQRLGKHPRIIHCKGRHKDGGLLLEYAPNGSLQEYLENKQIPLEKKIQLAEEIAEGVAYVHQQNILICDIHVRNILLDSNLHVKLCDFQGKLLGPDGDVLLSGGASENAESFMPRPDYRLADIKTDLFALGSTIYYIMTGHRPFPELDTIRDEKKISESYQQKRFPPLDPDAGGKVVHNCWSGNYKSANEVVNDLNALLGSYLPNNRPRQAFPLG